ncbi:unnamed protein product [Ranitomeya imitator]|uniref:Reverse transcriptase domain-containing protein n=1 Tax=Ranitomeya imitator TaxID=111125 RepID=A0ABN9LHK0_9NEOB|nr:unnamed protein product [Ranitomeya imitator]
MCNLSCDPDSILPNARSETYGNGSISERCWREDMNGGFSTTVSPLGVIPKKEPNSFHMIHHLSYPKGCRVDDNDYYDMCLPMGCSISCYYFELFSSFLDWVVRYETQCDAVTHYLDDFLFWGPEDSDLPYIAGEFGIPLSAEKTIGPVQTLTFFGIEIVSISMVFRLLAEKIQKMLSLIEGFISVNPCIRCIRGIIAADAILVGLISFRLQGVCPNLVIDFVPPGPCGLTLKFGSLFCSRTIAKRTLCQGRFLARILSYLRVWIFLRFLEINGVLTTGHHLGKC